MCAMEDGAKLMAEPMIAGLFAVAKLFLEAKLHL
jgi:hypothetical protein